MSSVWVRYIFVFLIISVVLSHSDISNLFYVVSGSTVLLLLAFYLKYNFMVTVPKVPLLLIAVIYTVYAIHIPSYITEPFPLGRALVFMIITPILIFIIPNLIDKEYFLATVAITSAIFIAVGIPSAVLGEYNLLMFSSTTRGLHPYVDVYRIESISTTSVTSGYIAFIGMISGLAIRQNRVRIPVIIVCAVGVFLPHSRAAYLSAVASICVLILYCSFSGKRAKLITMGATFVFSMFFLHMVGILSLQNSIELVDTAGRDEIFRAGVDAFVAEPLLGHGPGEMDEITQEFTDRYSTGAGAYNQFLRMFISTGIIGGGAYLLVITIGAVKYRLSKAGWDGAIVYAIFIGILFNEFFTGRGVFGLSHSSVIAALSLGYILSDAYIYQPRNTRTKRH